MPETDRAKNIKRNGYDAPETVREQDDLDRWRLASEIVEVVKNTPSEWSVRVGIFGRWGEGKSTVLRFAEQMLKVNGDLVFWFNPWSIRSWNGLWSEFSNSLHQALETYGIPVEGWFKSKARTTTSFFDRFRSSADTAASVNPISKAVFSVSMGALQAWLHPDSKQIAAIRSKLAGKRLVVLVDDLDRADPKLVPQLLLALRELLDLPGFTFILAFDDQIVTGALKDYHSAWTDGADFLEKILDFRFHLPPIVEAQKLRLVRRSIKQFCPFVPVESVDVVRDLLPGNARKLKALIRNLSVLRAEVERHDPDELSWPDILMAELLKLESQTVFEGLIGSDALEKECGIAYRLAQNHRNRRTDQVPDPNESLQRRFDEWGIKSEQLRARLIEIIEGIRARGGMTFRYQAEFALRPRRITGKEFREVLAAWKADRRPERISNWLGHQASRRSASAEEVSDEFFERLTEERQRELSRAAETRAMADHDLHVAEAGTLLDFVGMFLFDLHQSTPVRFEKLFHQFLFWSGFTTIASDGAMREREREFAISVVSGSHSDPCALLEVLRPWTIDDWEYEPKTIDLRKRLREACVDPIISSCCRNALELFRLTGGIQRLYENGTLRAVKFCLLNQESPLWKGELKRELMGEISAGANEPVRRDNCDELLSLLLSRRDLGIDSASPEDIRAALRDREFIRELWKTVTSKQIQYRMQSDYLKCRTMLVDSGIPEAELPLTPELEVRARERAEEQARRAEHPAANQGTGTEYEPVV